MKFLYPEFLWALLILIIPIVIHLFNLKRYKTLYFSSLSFMKNIEETTRSTQKLKNILVLLSRLLAFTALIFAFAQPFFGENKNNSSNLNSLTAFYIDNSFSMESRGPNGSILSEAKENAKEIINSASLASKYLVCTNVRSGLEERLLSKSEALEKIDKIDYSGIKRNIADILNWQNETVKKLKINNANIYCFSDFQEINCSKTDNINTNFNFKPVLFQGLENNNISIDSVWFSSPNRVKNKSNELNLKLNNHSNKAIENCNININLDGYRNSISTAIDANESATVTVNFKDATNGLKSGTINVSDNNMTFDNTMFLSYEVKKQLNVLIIDGEDFSPNFNKVYDLDNFYVPVNVKHNNLTRNDLQNKELIILNGLNTIPSGTIDMLAEFYVNGGTLALFPGANIKLNEWNSFLSELKLPQIKSTSNKNSRINKFHIHDRFFNGVFRDQDEKTSINAVKKHYSHFSNNKANSLPLISLQNGQSILEYNSSKGTAFILYTSLKKEYSSIVFNAIFPTITLRISELSQRKKPLYLTIGSESSYPVEAEKVENYPVHIKNNSFDFIPKIKQSNGIQYVSLPNNVRELKADNYQIHQKSIIDQLSLNYNRIESKLNYLKKDEIIDFYEKCGIENINFASINMNTIINDNEGHNSFGYWKYFVIMALVFFVLEMLIIRLIK